MTAIIVGQPAKEGQEQSGEGTQGQPVKMIEIQPAEKIQKNKLTVVIPYLKTKAQGNELLYAVRSIAKNFREDFNLVVIGDREDLPTSRC